MDHRKILRKEDVISNMPDNVVTYILDRLPIQDAVRTGILAKNWRYKWTMLSQLIFDKYFVHYLFERNAETKLGQIIYRLLLYINGVITKFALYIGKGCKLDVEDIAHWILFLSKSGVKDLTIWNMQGPKLKLSTHLFACTKLKYLKLFFCCLNPPASFHGFPNLLSFQYGLIQFGGSNFGEFLSQCPLLEILNARYPHSFFDQLIKNHRHELPETMNMDSVSVGKVKLVGIGKFRNLKILSLSMFDSVMITSILELVGFLPNLQELSLDLLKCKLTKDSVKKRLLSTFPSLKTLTLLTIDLCNNIMLSYALELIRSFSNLQTLEVTSDSNDDSTPTMCSPEVHYNTMNSLQLRNVVFTDLKGVENELCLIKYLLACSPFLKRIVIHPHSGLVSSDEKLFVRKLLKLHRASPKAEIDLR